LLKDVAVCETAGVVVRLPDWWKGGRPPRPRISVRVGQNRPAGLGADALLDFSAQMTLEGEPLTETEWAELLQSADGLALVRGKWVEVDPARLQEALAHWKQVEKLASRDGLTFFDGMRLIAGFQAGNTTAGTEGVIAPEREWAGVQAGPWLEQVLSELRDPARMSTDAPIPGLQAQLRPYQTVGVNWLWFFSRTSFNGPGWCCTAALRSVAGANLSSRSSRMPVRPFSFLPSRRGHRSQPDPGRPRGSL
jgi:non-specific serine/threonine protein kinase